MSRAKQKDCQTCGATFKRNRKYGIKQWENAKFCSKACFGATVPIRAERLRKPLRDLFLEKFNRPKRGCWNWQGTMGSYGYGVLYHNGKQHRAHVLALVFDGRAPDKGLLACHHCDNPTCVRPDHLYVGTPQDNARDAVDRGRLPRGQQHKGAKLSDTKVREARILHKDKRKSYAELARKYNVSRPTITRAIKGVTWGCVND